MTEFFSRTIGGMTLYASFGDSARFCLARYGEDAAKVVEAFWGEQKEGDFIIVPVFGYGPPPREELCTKQSLAAAFPNVPLKPESPHRKEWVRLLRLFGVIPSVNALLPETKGEEGHGQAA